MSRLDSLVKSLSAVGLYSLEKGTYVRSELEGYAVGLDILRTELEIILRECFFSTAESYGLERRERLWGKVRDKETAEIRRDMLTLRNSFGFDDFTPEGVKKALRFLGAEGTVEEFPSLFRVVIDLREKNYTQGERKFILSQIKNVFPAHLEADVVFRGLDWNASDKKALNFSQIDNKAYTWEQIDLLSI